MVCIWISSFYDDGADGDDDDDAGEVMMMIFCFIWIEYGCHMEILV